MGILTCQNPRCWLILTTTNQPLLAVVVPQQPLLQVVQPEQDWPALVRIDTAKATVNRALHQEKSSPTTNTHTASLPILLLAGVHSLHTSVKALRI